MGVTTYTDEVTTPIAAERLFKAFFVESNNLFPELLPGLIKSIKFIEGEGGAGTIKQIEYLEGGTWKNMKTKIDEFDVKNLVCKYSIFEGDMVGGELETISYDVKIEACGDGKCTCRTISKYHTKGDSVINEEEMKRGKEKSEAIFKAVEKHLVENPTIYA
ncbi:unnamed protein product [Cuscuta epithymum]|uniref:Bet v I/Major latex protein domain-containing protein n=1 Tax=Cuscuta epithymum TaxID=186058 RepID=A0AAV0CR80_9ASTE|nr:unnamed protein product [Cuscuta epithymum]